MLLRPLAAAGVLAVALVAAPASAQAPAPDPTGPAVTLAPPLDSPDDEVVHSWALAPVGSGTPDGPRRASLAYDVAPGATLQDAVTLYNFGNVDLTFRIYATDAFNEEDGNLALLTADEQPSEAGTWVKPDLEYVTVQAGNQVDIPFTVTVPDDAAPGDHVGALLASNEAVGEGEGGQAVLMDRRTGTVMYLRVDGPLDPGLEVAAVETTYHRSLNPFGGSATVSYRVSNTGNVRLASAATVSVSGPLGLFEQRLAPQEVPELLPGQSATIVTEVTGVPALGLLTTRVGLDASATGNSVGLVPSTATGSTFAPPIGLLLVLLVLLFLLLLVRRTRRRSAPPAAPAARRPEPQRT